jgi:hypothetical protein
MPSSTVGRIGIGRFLMNAVIVLAVLGVSVSCYYLWAPSGALIVVGLFVLLVFVNSRDHVPMGMHGRLIYRSCLESGEVAPPTGVPRWIARFASEYDVGLLILSLLGILLSTIALLVTDLFIAGRLLSRPVADLGMLQLFFVPHLVGLVTWALITLRQSMMEPIYKVALAEKTGA